MDSPTGHSRSAASSPSTGTVTSRCRDASGATSAATRDPSGSGSDGTATSQGASATRPYAVRLWCDTPWCRARGSAPDSRSAATGRPPSTAAALTASPAATPEKPNRVPVPRFPGPWATTATSAPTTCRAASRPVCTVTVSTSPPNDWPVVTVAASQPAARSPAAVRENHAGSAPPSCMT